MKATALLLAATALCSSCSTMSQSFELGAATGFLGGGLATYVAHTSVNGKASLEQVGMGAGLGLGVGLIAAYFTHKEVEAVREQFRSDETEMHFGDLPPSPFVVPKMSRKKGTAND